MAQKFIDERVEEATAFSNANFRSEEEFHSTEEEYYSWDAYTQEWFRQNVGEKIATEYAMFPMVYTAPSDVREAIQRFYRDVNDKVAKLRSIKRRLPLWAKEAPTTGVPADVAENGPIFVVHGSNLARAAEVARFIDRSTDREAVILHEQANRGRTLLEKFEHHAEAASFAVVLLTADDEGRKAGEAELRPRGRQNVVLELGFFFGRLRRGRVVVLVDPGVERPSDIDGLVYVRLDDAGVWKQELARELQAADIPVSVARIP
jgi:predicted nucleotide-binding protein